jgi:DNA-binding transcriptional LysR family regulator
LAALRAIARDGTFAGAGAELGYTQSAVSQQIAALERIAGTSLLMRASGRKPLGLTDAGKLVLRHGEAIVARAQALRADLETLEAGASGPLRVGTYPSVGARLLPSLLPMFTADWPLVEVQLHESNADAELLGLVEQGELDLTFSMLPLADGPFEGIELLRDPWLLVLAPSAMAGDAPGSGGRAGAAHRLLCFRSCPNIAEIAALLREWGIEPTVVFRSDDNATLQALVGAGVGAAFMPWLTVDRDDPSTALVDVSGKLPSRRVAIAWHRDRHRSPASHAFVEAAVKVSAALAQAIAQTTLLMLDRPGRTRNVRADRSRPTS